LQALLEERSRRGSATPIPFPFPRPCQDRPPGIFTVMCTRNSFTFRFS
jgi:hypothetical protein